MSERASKTCPVCGRDFAWRKKWANCWDQVKYCSARCRSQSKHSQRAGARLEEAIVELVTEQGPGKTLCPSEVARAVDPDNWRSLMDPVRRAANRLAKRGRIEIRQRGQAVCPESARGAIRLVLLR